MYALPAMYALPTKAEVDLHGPVGNARALRYNAVQGRDYKCLLYLRHHPIPMLLQPHNQ